MLLTWKFESHVSSRWFIVIQPILTVVRLLGRTVHMFNWALKVMKYRTSAAPSGNTLTGAISIRARSTPGRTEFQQCSQWLT
ncbi:hypothetical protein C8R47DRAFT_224697 [Mycena vitilis]|nr:hypothetical protein C8R47DRAFT_224697 [Mycena vitilis]